MNEWVRESECERKKEREDDKITIKMGNDNNREADGWQKIMKTKIIKEWVREREWER